jgi:hypothetical protein
VFALIIGGVAIYEAIQERKERKEWERRRNWADDIRTKVISCYWYS